MINFYLSILDFFMELFYNQSPGEVLDQLQTDKQQGLSAAEARKRLDEYGANSLSTKGSKSFLKMFVAQF
ncbi:MAG TPA: hypothetical protein DCL86_01065, partial [Bacteroidales bacterium]|nr:hypothetical protein [Bacteroidales bacterium]